MNFKLSKVCLYLKLSLSGEQRIKSIEIFCSVQQTFFNLLLSRVHKLKKQRYKLYNLCCQNQQNGAKRKCLFKPFKPASIVFNSNMPLCREQKLKLVKL